ncbi:MAG TPA: SDR family oxidoreductase [Dehalococcoidia bacterium]|nr:SDR family oxidoreductase [Dehalococcoidia bacterium]
MIRDQIAVITGGAKGIGRQIALTYAHEGAKVAIVDLDRDRLRKTERELRGITEQVLALEADIRQEHLVERMLAQAADHFGGIDVLVNNAGIVPHFAWGVPRWPRIREMEEVFWDRVLSTNLGGTFLCTKHVLPYMEQRRSGHVITLHGGGGMGSCVYVVSKDAIRTFTRFVAEEEREYNVCVICVSPGSAIATEDAPDEARQRMPGPETVQQHFLLAAEAGMQLSGKVVTLKDGKLEVVGES